MSYYTQENTIPYSDYEYNVFNTTSDNNYNETYDGNITLVHDDTSVYGSNPNMLITGLMIGIIIIFSSLLCYMLLPVFILWLRQKIPISASQINRRYEGIEGWLITKRVKTHCDVCEALQQQFGSSGGISNSETVQIATTGDVTESIICDNSHEGHQCPICMESFVVNDLVSWSPSIACDHVFHHSCIKAWLLHHECCPCCRVYVLPVDNKNVEVGRRIQQSPFLLRRNQDGWGQDKLKEFAIQRYERIRSTYFCVQEGLVKLDRHNVTNCSATSTIASSNKSSGTLIKQTKDMPPLSIKRFLISDVKSDDLIELRTHSKSLRTSTDVVVVVTPSTIDDDGRDNESNSVYDPDLREKVGDTIADTAIERVDIEVAMKERPLISSGIDMTNKISMIPARAS